MNTKIEMKKIILTILAVFVMFLPRRLEIINIFSFRLFIIIAMLLCFVYKKSIKISILLDRPLYIIFLLSLSLNYIINSEIISLIGFLMDNVILMLILFTIIENKNDLDYFCILFCKILLIYCILCIVEFVSGFNIWSLFIKFERNNNYYRYGFCRSMGSFTTSINNGVFLLLTFPIIFYIKEYTHKIKFANILEIFVWIAIITTLSRTPILGAILMSILLNLRGKDFTKRNKLKIFIFIMVIFCLIFIPKVRYTFNKFSKMFIAVIDTKVADEISDTFGSNANGIGHRLELYNWVYNSIKNKWIGNGANAYFNYEFVTTQGSTHVKKSIENYYLATFYKFGYVGLICLIMFFIENIEKCIKSKKIDLSGFIKRILIVTVVYYIMLFFVSASDEFKMLLILVTLYEKFLRIGKETD